MSICVNVFEETEIINKHAKIVAERCYASWKPDFTLFEVLAGPVREMVDENNQKTSFKIAQRQLESDVSILLLSFEPYEAHYMVSIVKKIEESPETRILYKILESRLN